MSNSTYVRYERRGTRVVPVRVTKQWTTQDVKSFDGRREPKLVRKFKATRVSEIGWGAIGKDAAREAHRDLQADNLAHWTSGAIPQRVESRERLLTLCDAQGEPVVQEAGFDQHWLPLGDVSNLSAHAAAWSLDNGNGWAEREAE